jgi:hypothetical protein
MGYVGLLGIVVLSLLHARPSAAMIAAPAMHAIVRISVFFMVLSLQPLQLIISFPKLEFIIKNYSKFL